MQFSTQDQLNEVRKNIAKLEKTQQNAQKGNNVVKKVMFSDDIEMHHSSPNVSAVKR